MAKHILITNIVTLNTGDAAILQGMIDIIRTRYGNDCKITVFDRSAAAARKYYNWADFRQSLFPPKWKSSITKKIESIGYGHWFNRLRYIQIRILLILLQGPFSFPGRLIAGKELIENVKQYMSADLIVSTGGTYLTENYNLDSCRYDYEISLLCKAKFGFFTQTLGPFKKNININKFSKIFRNADFIFLRDEKSKQHILDLGVQEEKIHLAADAAFVLRGGNDSHKQAARSQDVTFRIAISVRSMKNFYERLETQYHRSVAKAVESLAITNGIEVSFLSTCQGIKEYWTDDAQTAEKICAFLPSSVKEKVILDTDFREPKEIIDVYSTFDLVVATRMHSAILAICAGTPTIGIAYEFKIIELFKNLGFEELCLSVEQLSDTELENRVLKILGNIENYRQKTRIKSEEMSVSARSVDSRLPEL